MTNVPIGGSVELKRNFSIALRGEAFSIMLLENVYIYNINDTGEVYYYLDL